jgi:hypothetical protein
MEEETQHYDPIEARRDEIAQYDANIAMYQAIAATLPTSWPKELEEHRNPRNQHKALRNVPADKVQQVSELWYADDVAHAIKTETLERTKAAAILAALEAAQ